MIKKFLLISLVTSSISFPALSEEINPEQALIYTQMMNQFKNTQSSDLDKTASSDPDLVTLMEVFKMVQNKNNKDAVKTLEKLLKNPKGKSITPQAKLMIQNLIDVMKAMESGQLDLGN